MVAFSGGAGLAPFAPGTWGTLVAFPLHAVLQPHVSGWWMLLLIAVLFAVGAWACDVTGRALGMSDYGGMVWDETVAFLLVLMFTPAGWLWQATAFGLFRLFDIVKPPPVRFFDRSLKSGFGVMFDDLLAAGYSVLVLAILEAVF